MNIKGRALLGLIILSFSILVGCTNAKATTGDNSTIDSQGILSKAFVEGDHSISIVEVALPYDETKIVNDISARFKSSIEKNQQWFSEYVSKYSESEDMLPWDEKFGISKEEYDQMISSVDRMKLIEKSKTTISIIKEADGTLKLNPNKDLPYLSGLKIDTTNNSMITSSGVFKYSSAIEASDEQRVTGRWSGGTWVMNFEELKDVNNIDKSKTYGSINISVGQLEKTKQMIVYYKERVVHQGVSYKGEEVFVFND